MSQCQIINELVVISKVTDNVDDLDNDDEPVPKKKYMLMPKPKMTLWSGKQTDKHRQQEDKADVTVPDTERQRLDNLEYCSLLFYLKLDQKYFGRSVTKFTKKHCVSFGWTARAIPVYRLAMSVCQSPFWLEFLV